MKQFVDEKELRSAYGFYQREAINDYLGGDHLRAIAAYSKGVMYGVGLALGYKPEAMKSDFAEALAAEEKRLSVTASVTVVTDAAAV